MSTDASSPDDGQTSRANELSLHDELLADMVANGTTLIDACRDLGLCMRVVYRRLEKPGAFADAMNEARRVGYDVIATRTRAIMRGDRAAGSTGDPRRDKWIVEQDMKLLSKWSQKTYGEKLEVETHNRNLDVTISDDPVEAARQYSDFMKGR